MENGRLRSLPHLKSTRNIVRIAARYRAGVLNRAEISPMGEILGIQGGNESV